MVVKKRKPAKKQKQQKELAVERIERLFSLAEINFRKNPERSHRYISLARKIAIRFNIRLKKDLKRKFCKRCYRYLVPGVNCAVRVRSSQQSIITKCLECGNIMRHPYRKERGRK